MNLVTIETSRLLLKGFSPEDMNYIFDTLSKLEIMKLLGHRSEEDYIKEEFKHKKGYASYNRSFKLFLLTDKESGIIIGRCGIHNWSEEDRRAEIGYVMVDDDFKKQGFMSEAVEAIIDYGFKDLKLNRLEAIVRVGNFPSIKLLEKNKFIKEGIMRQHTRVDDKFEDSFLYSRLFNEYEEGQPTA